MDRQTLRDWVIRYNDHGVAGLADLPKGHNPEKLTEEESKRPMSTAVFPDPWVAKVRPYSRD
jgi:transposase